ncbi:MAG: class I SAM-dependent methyltransferase, partial [Pseudolabrys sp.]
GGRLPPVRSNVRLIKGFFEDTLPGFIGEHRGAKIALMHVDCDLYSATKTIFANVADMLAPGTIIIFDELINYHGGREVGEFKAFMEFTAERKLSFEYVAYNRTGSQVAVRILDVTAPTK